MAARETKIYVLKPYKASSRRKPSSQVPTSKDFLDKPAPAVIFHGRSFCFTGVFAVGDGDRNKCEAAATARGGFCYARPNRALNYLVVGSFAEPSWSHQSFGRKIATVLELKSAGAKCQVVSEEHWSKAVEKTPELPQGGQTPSPGHSKSDQLIQLQQELDQLRRNQQLLVDALQKELGASDYRKLAKRLRVSGVVI